MINKLPQATRLRLKDALSGWRKSRAATLPVDRRDIENVGYLPDWKRLIDRDPTWRQQLERCVGAPKILLPTMVGGLGALSSMESLLAVALTLRGYEVHILLCDQALPACLRLDYTTVKEPEDVVSLKFQDQLCRICQRTGDYLFSSLGVKVHYLSNFLTSHQRDTARQTSLDIDPQLIPQYTVSGIRVGEHAYAGTLRYFASGNLDDQALGTDVLRRYLEASILTMDAIQEITCRYQFHSSCFNHGIYCPHGVIGEVLRARKVRVTTWNIAYRKRCFIFSHHDTYHHTLLNEPNSNWEDIHLGARMQRQITSYLRSRLMGSRDWIWFHEKPIEDLRAINETLGLDPGKPIIGMLTNVMWDAQLHYKSNAFPNMLSWVLDTIAYFARRPELQLVIRIHPAEIRGTLPSKQPLLAEIAKHWPTLPDNIRVIGPESQISTYAVMEECDSVIIYATKTGVELTSMGIPVIVAGEAWIRNRKVTYDASTSIEYEQLLNALPFNKRLDDGIRTRALKYAFHFFYRRMIPLKCMKATGAWPPYQPNIRALRQLNPGVDRGLDVICDGITNGTEFIYPAEKLVTLRQKLKAHLRQARVGSSPKRL